MATLSANVVVRDPRTGEPVALPAGSALPAWAAPLVDTHVLSPDVSADARKAVRGPAKTGAPKD